MPALTEQLQQLRRYYESGATRSYESRRERLLKLKETILRYERAIYEALHADLKKSPEESWVTEVGFMIAEINETLKGLKYWMQPEKVATTLVNLPSTSFILREPLGVVLVMAPWNYPFQLLFNPLVGAIAAGNCVALKPSEFAAATAKVMGDIVREVFPPEYVLYVEGDGAEVVPDMMNNFRFNHVFYTGSTAIGKIIYRMAAEQLVPVTLELGGKSPCVVESDANIKVAARRIAMTKFSNAGQMCVAPDYVLVHTSKKEALIKALKTTIPEFFSNDPSSDYSYCKIINEKQFNRITTYLQQGTIVFGGQHDVSKLFISPTILENVSLDSPVMKDEIFGPVLPIIPFSTMDEAKKIIATNPDPLAFYIYTKDAKKERAWLNAVSFGGGCVNNSSWHLTNYHLPFGGRGNSGIGQYHGQYSFEIFSHRKSIMKTPTWFDPSIKYPPFKGRLRLFKWIIR